MNQRFISIYINRPHHQYQKISSLSSFNGYSFISYFILTLVLLVNKLEISFVESDGNENINVFSFINVSFVYTIKSLISFKGSVSSY